MRPIKFRFVFKVGNGVLFKFMSIDEMLECDFPLENMIESINESFGDTHAEDVTEFECISKDQFTGLTDKNGVDIYEKDIIRTYHFTDKVTRKDEYLYHVVTWSEMFHGWFMLSCSSMDENDGSIHLFAHLRANKSIEVHSNIHQSPELMESK